MNCFLCTYLCLKQLFSISRKYQSYHTRGYADGGSAFTGVTTAESEPKTPDKDGDAHFWENLNAETGFASYAEGRESFEEGSEGFETLPEGLKRLPRCCKGLLRGALWDMCTAQGSSYQRLSVVFALRGSGFKKQLEGILGEGEDAHKSCLEADVRPEESDQDMSWAWG